MAKKLEEQPDDMITVTVDAGEIHRISQERGFALSEDDLATLLTGPLFNAPEGYEVRMIALPVNYWSVLDQCAHGTPSDTVSEWLEAWFKNHWREGGINGAHETG